MRTPKSHIVTLGDEIYMYNWEEVLDFLELHNDDTRVVTIVPIPRELKKD